MLIAMQCFKLIFRLFFYVDLEHERRTDAPKNTPCQIICLMSNLYWKQNSSIIASVANFQ